VVKKNVVVGCALFVAVVAVFASSVRLFAGDDDQAAKDQYAQMMEMMKKMGAVGPAHEVLQQLVGDWVVDCTMYSPTGPEMSKGKSKVVSILGGRYIQQTYQGEFGGEKFEGLGISGFDNAKQQYSGVWMDSMSTSIFSHYGTFDEATKTFTYNGQCDDPMSGNRKSKSVLRIESPDRHVFEMWDVTDSANEMKQMELVYVRK
jgi:hypothetical protein